MAGDDVRLFQEFFADPLHLALHENRLKKEQELQSYSGLQALRAICSRSSPMSLCVRNSWRDCTKLSDPSCCEGRAQ